MIRLALWILSALILGGLVHLSTVLLLPSLATQDAYARVAAVAPVNSVIPIPAPTPEKAIMPFMDPAFTVSVCRYDLSRGPLKFSVPISQAYTSVSFYTRSDVAYYAINDRAAGRRVIELDLAKVVPSVSGPKFPQDRIDLPKIKERFETLFSKPANEKGYGKPAAELDKRVGTQRAGVDVG